MTQENADSSDLERSPLDGEGQVRAEHEPVAEAAAPAPQPPAAIPENDLPSDVRSYALSLAPQGSPGLREGQPRPQAPQAAVEEQTEPATPQVPQAAAEEQTGPATPQVPQAAVEEQTGPATPQAPPRAPAASAPRSSSTERGQWPQAPVVKVWKRYDNNAARFRVSSSTGPQPWTWIRTRSSPTRPSPAMKDRDA